MVSERAAGQSLAHAATTPAALFGAFVKLDRKLTRAIDRAEKGESVSNLVDQIERGKLAIVDDQMQGPIDGVKGSEWFRDLDCVDAQLLVAKLVDQGHLTIASTLGGHDKAFVASLLKAAKK